MKRSFPAALLAGILLASSGCSNATGPLGSGVDANPLTPRVAAASVASSAESRGKHRRHPHGNPIPTISVGVEYKINPMTVGQVNEIAIALTNTLASGAPPPALTNVAFKVKLPLLPGSNFVVAPGATLNNCGGALQATVGANFIGLSGAAIGSNKSCVIVVPLTTSDAGSYVFAMAPGTISSDQGLTNINPYPNPTLVVKQSPKLSVAHLYVPVPSANTIQAYQVGNGVASAPQFTIQSSALSNPGGVVVDGTNGNIYVNNLGVHGNIVVFKGISTASTGTVVPTAAQTMPFTVPFDVDAMTLDPNGWLVLVASETGYAGMHWYSTSGTASTTIPTPAGQSWTTITSDGARFVIPGDTFGHTASTYLATGGPPPATEGAACNWSVAAIVQNPWSSVTSYDPFTLAYGAGLVYYGSSHPKGYVNPNTNPPTHVEAYYGDVSRTSECNGTLVSQLHSVATMNWPPSNGNGLTYLSGVAVDPQNGDVAAATVPNYNTAATILARSPRVDAWLPFSGIVTSGPSANPSSYGPGGAAGGTSLAQPAYGP